MKNVLSILLLCLAPTACAAAPPPPPVAITNVTVIDTTGGPVKKDMTVVVVNGRIAELGQSKSVKPPKDAQIVDGRGKFLIPGLWDMHAHWYDATSLQLFTANGVTGVRIMWGSTLHHEWRSKIDAGTLVGPRLAIASTIIDGPKPIWPGSTAVATEAEARAAVQKEKAAGADFIKVYSLLPREAFLAIADECRKQGLRFDGHVPISVSVREASEAGMRCAEHLTGVITSCSSREDELRKEENATMDMPFGSDEARAARRKATNEELDTFDPAHATALFKVLAANHSWECPTLVVLRNISNLADPALTNDPRLKYVPKSIREMWNPKNDFRFKNRTPEDEALSRRMYAKQLEIVGMMRKSGVEFVAGTDVLNPYCFPGFSLHDELELLVSAGLTPMEALQAATRNPAKMLGRENELGVVAKGMLADLVLLDANPLESIGNTRKITAVIEAGRLYSRADLDHMLTAVETAAAK